MKCGIKKDYGKINKGGERKSGGGGGCQGFLDFVFMWSEEVNDRERWRLVAGDGG